MFERLAKGALAAIKNPWYQNCRIIVVSESKCDENTYADTGDVVLCFVPDDFVIRSPTQQIFVLTSSAVFGWVYADELQFDSKEK